MLEELTLTSSREYRLAWVHDYGGPSLRYADRYDIIGVPFDDIEEMLEDGASKDAIVLYLHEIASDIDEEEEHKRQWRDPAPDHLRNQPARLAPANAGSPAVEGTLAMTTRADTTARGYGGPHQKLRKQVARWSHPAEQCAGAAVDLSSHG